MPKQKFYVVWKGRKKGIFDSWAECEIQVKGFVDAEYKAFGSRAEAERAFAASYADYKGKPASSQKWLFAPNPPVIPSICVDAACDGSPGRLEYRGVLTGTGEQVFRAGPFADGTNNVGEFLAIVLAMDWLITKKMNIPIYSDSDTAIAWVKAGKCNTKLERLPSNKMLFDFVARAEQTLRVSKTFRILKWDTEAWGENPADFGRK
ncbi:MAG: ribonuclease H family protein [Chloroflexi bacterium]|nr:ribonuclease H family protein [Chloroflexota bacterium]